MSNKNFRPLVNVVRVSEKKKPLKKRPPGTERYDAGVIKHTSAKGIVYPATKGDSGYKWLFLNYRTIMLSDDYCNYCIHRNKLTKVQCEKSKEEINSLQAKYPKISIVFNFWGDLSKHIPANYSKQFNSWLADNFDKVEFYRTQTCNFVKVNEPIISEPESIYISLPQQCAEPWLDKKSEKALLNELQTVIRKYYEPTEFNAERMTLGELSITDMDAVEKRLDVYFLKKHYKMSAREIAYVIQNSNKGCWQNEISSWHAVDFTNLSVPIADIRNIIDPHASKAVKQITFALNNQFPKVK